MTDAPLNSILDDLEDRYGESIPDDALYESLTTWAESTGRPMYPHQEEALLASIEGQHLIVATPTGSGKSLVAVSALFVGLARGLTGYYTAPLKALVSEKFFDLIGLFGAANVGMVTGDSSINPNAPIICCTAEILANIALRDGKRADVGVVIADEFHFYAEKDRGWAWQVPLLELPQAQHVLLSATLGDTTFFEKDLTCRTGRDVAVISDAPRPVPLTFSYVRETVSETVKELVETHRSPVYIVHFSQASAVAAALELQSVAIANKDHKAAIAAEIGDFRFGPGFGSALSKLVRAGIGVHHAGMLPRYRRLVERLAQQGLLRVICGTDTLGVGINVPIRTVLITSLAKYDGSIQRQLSAREFHQIAGRAGRAGFDTTGEVVVLAPEHEIENAKAEAKAGDDPKKRKKIQKKKPPEGQVNWTEKTFERLVAATPETLTSTMKVSHSMILQLLARDEDPVDAAISLLGHNHNPPTARNPLYREAIDIYTSLLRAGVVEHKDRTWQLAHPGEPTIELAREIPNDFALNAPLSPFALAALDLLDKDSPEYALDVVSVIESVQEDPRPILMAQRRKERDRAFAAMKEEGLEYNERMARLDEITWPQPLAEELTAALATYAQTNPWVAGHSLSPKSVVRDMLEKAMTFTDLISANDAARSEGVVLRYLTDTYRAMRQIIPAEAMTEELEKIIDWLGNLVASVDSSLIAEWEALADGAVSAEEIAQINTIPQGSEERAYGAREDGTVPITANMHAFALKVRTWMWRFVEAAAKEDVDELERLTRDDAKVGRAMDADAWDEFLDDYFESHEWLGADTNSRSAQFVEIQRDVDDADLELLGLAEELEGRHVWIVRQILDDGLDSRDTQFTAIVDIGASADQDRVVASLVQVGDR